MLKRPLFLGLALFCVQLDIRQILPSKPRISPNTSAKSNIITGPAQAYPGDPFVKLEPQLAKYYHHINQAARAIYVNDFRSAAACYDSAFLCKKHPFFVDLKNYIIVNSKCAAYEKNGPAIQWLFEAKKCDTASLFQALPKRVFSAENLTLIDRLETKYHWKNKPENKDQKTIRELYASAQALLLDFGGMNMHDPECAREFYAKKDSINQDNCKRFLALCTTNGFPNEEKLGIYAAENEAWSNMVYMLLWGFVSSKDRTDQHAVIAVIQQAVQDGNLHHSRAACLFDLVWQNSKVKASRYNFLNSTIELINGDAYRPFVFFSDSLMREVNTNRVSIGLDSFHVVQKQVVCQYFGAKKAAAGAVFLTMAHYANISAGVPLGLVKIAFKEAGLEMSAYRINTEKILEQCRCAEKVY